MRCLVTALILVCTACGSLESECGLVAKKEDDQPSEFPVDRCNRPLVTGTNNEARQ